jgi:hypothetical protein
MIFFLKLAEVITEKRLGREDIIFWFYSQILIFDEYLCV